jgi:hypothetical protein
MSRVQAAHVGVRESKPALHAMEAFMLILPIEKRNGGWE